MCVQKFTLFFLNIVIYSYQILYATSNSCKLSFHILTKKFIDGKPLKIKLAGKNTALRKFHVSVHLMTPVDREGIISKKIMWELRFYIFVEKL